MVEARQAVAKRPHRAARGFLRLAVFAGYDPKPTLGHIAVNCLGANDLASLYFELRRCRVRCDGKPFVWCAKSPRAVPDAMTGPGRRDRIVLNSVCVYVKRTKVSESSMPRLWGQRGNLELGDLDTAIQGMRMSRIRKSTNCEPKVN